MTFSRAFGGAIASGVTFEIHTINPALFTTAGNEAIYKSYPLVYRPVESHYVLRYFRDFLGLPRNMRTFLRIREGGTRKFFDVFDRADSSTSAGSNYTASVGTWGISSERLYSASDADADIITLATSPVLRDGYARFTVRGTLNHASTYRIPVLLFRVREDYTGAIDNTTCLILRLQNGVVDLRKNDGGTESSLTTATQTTTNGVDYIVEVLWYGNRVRIWVDDIEVINYQLLGTDLKYMDYPRVSFRWDKGGAPGTAARIDDFWLFALAPMLTLHEGEETYDQTALWLSAFSSQMMGQYSTQPSSVLGRLYHIEGRQTLTEMAADTTQGTIASDNTAVLEIQTTDPAWNVLVDTTKKLLYEQLSQPGNTVDDESRAEYAARAKDAAVDVMESRTTLGMPRPRITVRHP